MAAGSLLKRLVFYVGGLLIVTFAIALIILADVGAGPWDAVFVGLNKQWGLTVGTWVYLVQVLIVGLNALLLREKPDFLSFVTIFLRGFMLDMWLYVVLRGIEVSDWGLRYALMTVGTILLGIGISAYLIARFPKSPIDGLMMAVHRRFGLNVRVSRTVVEVTAVAIGFVLGGPIGVGTVVISLLLGSIIQFSNKQIVRLYHGQGDYPESGA